MDAEDFYEDDFYSFAPSIRDLPEVDIEEDDIDIGTCFCGAYGKPGAMHVRMIDGQMEECGEYL